ncbi:MAG: DUF2062 domain-containing protein [Verrucomicrobiota bacterium]
MNAPNICVVIPVYNHALTLQRVIRGARAAFPVIVVNDGSTDDTGKVLAGEVGITVITLAANQGKGSALKAGFERAEDMGFSHAITIDADGQHQTSALAEFAASCRQQPDAFIIGVRDLKKEGAPFGRRFSNDVSTFWFRFETGVRLADTQCGYRCYPLAAIRGLPVKSERYAYELEIMVKAAWAGIPLQAQPVAADYAAPTSRMSHFHPWRDLLQISRVHSRLCTQAFCLPAPLRRLVCHREWQTLPGRQRFRAIFRHVFSENTGTPGRFAAAVGLGLFCGIAPIWGFQMLAAAFLAHQWRLNKAIALAASNISFPLVAPFLMAAGLVLGHYLHTGQMVQFAPQVAAQKIPAYFSEWFVGSVVLALLVGVAGMVVAYGLARFSLRTRPKT